MAQNSEPAFLQSGGGQFGQQMILEYAAGQGHGVQAGMYTGFLAGSTDEGSQAGMEQVRQFAAVLASQSLLQ